MRRLRTSHADLHLRHHRPAEGRDAVGVQCGLRHPRRSSTAAGSPRRRPGRTTSRCRTCRCATSPSASSRSGSTPAPACRSTSPSRSRRCSRTCARCSRPSCSGCPRIWEKILAGGHIRMASATWLKRSHARLWLRVADRIGDTLVAHRRPAHRRHPAGVRDRLGVLLPGAAGADRHAPGPLRRLGRRPDRAGRAAVLHGHRGADARGLRHDREHRRRHRQPSGPGQAGHGRRAARRASSCGSTRTTGEILTRHPGTFVGYFRDPEATAAAKTPDGWLHTGDVGEWVDGTHVRITDRAKDIIITAGREERGAERDRERAQGVPVHQGGDRHRRPPPVPGGADRHRAGHGRRLGAAARLAYTTYRDLSRASRRWSRWSSPSWTR